MKRGSLNRSPGVERRLYLPGRVVQRLLGGGELGADERLLAQLHLRLPQVSARLLQPERRTGENSNFKSNCAPWWWF